MDTRVARYIRHGKFYVGGWLRTEAALTIVALGERQRALGVAGGTAEIGVHHGKLFILLYLLSRAPERAVAIDLFQDQHLNVDQSGSGDLSILHRNLLRHADDTRLVLHQGSSMDLTSADLVRLAEGPLRLVSVDGGHTPAVTAHDLAVVDAALAEGGIIVLDDVFSEQWPGVADGLHRHFAQPRNLVPFAIGANKTYLCRPSHRDAYRAAAAAVPSITKTAEFLGEPVAVLQFAQPRLVDRLTSGIASSPLWRWLRTTPIGPRLRWAWFAGYALGRSLMRREDY